MRTRSTRFLPHASLAALAILLASQPRAARAQAFDGSAAVTFGSATIDRATPGVDNITATSARSTILWTPTDTGIGGGPIDFLANGNVVNYSSAVGPATILNRIIPTDTTRAIRFDGLVNSTADTAVWFYSPGGLLIGSTAQFNVGSLLLSTSDLVESGGDFMPVTGQFSVDGVAGSSAGITIEPGAQLRAETVGQNNYIVAVGASIVQDGNVSARGSVALVAAEDADFAIDGQGLFNISVTQGTDSGLFQHNGTTGGPDAAGAGEKRRVYMVAVPKNNAITMAIASGGDIGFDVAGAVNIVDNTVVLSAGYNVADSGSGNPIVAAPAGSADASVFIARGNYTSGTYVRGRSGVEVSDSTAAGNPDIAFAGDLNVGGGPVQLRAVEGNLTIAGALDVDVSASATQAAANIVIRAEAGRTLSAQSINLSSNDTSLSPFAFAGTVDVTVEGGSISTGALTINASAQGVNASGGGSGGDAQGGLVSVSANAGGTIAVTSGILAVNATGLGGIGGDIPGDVGGQGRGGTVTVEANGSGSAITQSGGALFVEVRGTGGNAGPNAGRAGAGMAGNATVQAIGGGAIRLTSGQVLKVDARGIGGSGGDAGAGNGGVVNIVSDDGIISTTGNYGFDVDARGIGGNASNAIGNGGAGFGGAIGVETRGVSGRIETNIGGGTGGMMFSGLKLLAGGDGGATSAAGTNGGSAIGGNVRIATTGAGQQIINHSAMGTQINLFAFARDGNVGEGGNATGGTAIIDIAGGSYNGTAGGIGVFAAGQGGAGDIDGAGTAIGGNALVTVAGSLSITGEIALAAGANALSGGTAASAFGGVSSLIVDGGTVAAGGGLTLDVGTFAGSGGGFDFGDAIGGTAELTALNGANVAFAGNLTLETRALGGNTGADFGGDAIGGTGIVRAKNADIALATGGGSISLQNEAIPGMGDFPGQAIITNALFETTGTGRIALGSPIAGGAGDITIAASLTAGNPLYATFSAANDVTVNQSIVNTFAGSALVLRAGNAGSTTATVDFGGGSTIDLQGGGTIDIYTNPAAIGTPTDYSANIVSGALTNYQLIHSLADLQAINGFLGQSFALGRDIDASPSAAMNAGLGFVPIGTDGLGNVTGSGFTGKFDGLDHRIDGLFINRPSSQIGLFGWTNGATIKNVVLRGGAINGQFNTGALAGAAINTLISNAHSSANVFSNAGDVGGLIGHTETGTLVLDSSSSGVVGVTAGQFSVGGLVGYNNGTIQRSWATGNVSLDGAVRGVGGLVGFNDGVITQSFASGNVTGGPAIQGVGGLVGYIRSGTVDFSYATGDVIGATDVGGFVGTFENGTVSNAYASGLVTGSANVGGFVGNNIGGALTDAYWDTFSTGQASGFGADTGSIVNLDAVTSDPGQMGAPNDAFSAESYLNFNPFAWTNFAVGSRPIGVWEVARVQYGVATIRNTHQLQLAERELSGNYRLDFDIDAYETARLAGVWGDPGFFPLGDFRALFSGTFDGGGKIVSNLSIDRSAADIGLFGRTSGLIRDLGLVNVSITAAAFGVGGLAGVNEGNIARSFVTGSVTGAGTFTGGLVGANLNTGSIDNSYASASVTGANSAGGLAGLNAGTIAFSYADGTVSAGNAGGLVGTNATLATVGNSYWNSETSGIAVACGTDDGSNCGAATGLTNAQSVQAASYAGWSLDTVGGLPNIWRIYDGATAPLLKAFLTPLTLQAQDLTVQYDTNTPSVGVVPPGADPLHIFGVANVSGLSSQAGTYSVAYVDGHFSDQRGYDLIASVTPGTLTITPAPLSVTANADSRIYGDANPVFTYNSTGLLGADALTGSLDTLATVASGIGTSAITLGTLDNPNYAISYTGADLTITPRALSVTADTANRIYGDANPAFTYAVGGMGLVNGDTVTGSLDSLADGLSNVGSYSIDQGTLDAGPNYTLSYSSANLDVFARAITVTGDSLNRIYGDANPALTFTVGGAGLANGDMLSGTLDTLAGANSNVGTYAVTQGTLSASSNYALTYVDGSIAVTPRALTIAADPLSRLYGDANPALTFIVGGAGLVNGDMLTGALSTGATVISNVGAYAIAQGTLDAGGNYAITYAGDTLTVTPRPLSVTADALSRLYGDANPAFTYTALGLVNGDILFGALDSAATVTSNVGSYAIGQGTLDNSNYAIGYTTANLDVLARPIAVTGDSLSRVYGDVNPALTFTVGGAGLVNGDTLSGALDTLAGMASNVGSYAVTQGTLSASSNYVLTYFDGNMTVTPRALTIIADALTRTYGDANPALTYAVGGAGLVNGDMLTGALATGATVASNIGAYAIAQGTLDAGGNYAVSYLGNSLTVTPRALSVTADAAARIYGDANPVFTHTTSGLVNGDTLSGALASLATVTSNVGGYAIDQGTLAASANYALNYTGATLTVSQRALSVTADALTRLYGDANPGLTFTATGLVNGDTLSGALATLAGATSNIGSYGVTQGSLAASPNYALTFTDGSLAVTPRPLAIMADSLSRFYGDANPALTFAATGLVNGDTLSGAPATIAGATSNVGSYGVTQGTLTASPNYTVTFTGGSLVVTPRALAIVADAASRVYGDANSALSFTTSGLVNGDAVSGVLTTVATAASGVGSYAIGQGTLAASPNYAVGYTGANLTILARPLTITADAIARVTGEANPALTYAVGGAGLVNGDALTGALDTTANATSPAGTYAIGQGSLSAGANYAISYVGANLTVTLCSSTPGCAPPMEVMAVVQQIGNTVQQQEEQASEPASEEEKEEAAAEASEDPKVMISSVIDTSSVDQPLTVNEPVAASGNTTLWLPGEPQ